jgi:glutamate carboxypeptidase
MLKRELDSYFERKLDSYLDLLKQMVDINSFTANADGVNRLGELTIACFSDLGFSSRRYPSRNPSFGDHIVLSKAADSGTERPNIALVSHLDTVFPLDEEKRNQFSWRVEGDRIFGPGTVDIKGGTVLMFMVLDGLREINPVLFHGVNWYILLNAAEETLEAEFGELCRKQIPKSALACLVFEGGRRSNDRYSIVTARKGMATYRIMVEGKAAHAGSAHQSGSNAIVKLAQVVTTIAKMTDYDRQLTFNVGTVAGGTVINRVPHMAVASGEMRAFESDILNAGIADLKALEDIGPGLSRNGEFPSQVHIEIINRWRPWSPNRKTNILLSLWSESASDMGWEVVAEERGGLSDANQVWDHVPTLDGLGPSGGNAHCSERNADRSKEQEYVFISSFIPKAILNTRAINSLIEGNGEKRAE